MKGLNKIYGRILDGVVLPGSFRPNGASGIVSGSTKGKGFSVARTSAGLYTLTFDEKWVDLVTFQAGLRCRAAEPATIAFGSVVSQANKTAQIRVFQAGAGSAAAGYIPIDISSAREIAGNDIQNLAAHGGLMASDSVPDILRINGATDKALRITWAATEVDEIQLPPIPIPPDLDASADVEVHACFSKGTNTDTDVTVDCQAWLGVGDTEMGGNFTLPNDTVFNEVIVTLSAADIGATPNMLNLQLIPGAHANDSIMLYAMWLEYTKLAAATPDQTWALTDLTADADNEVNFLAILRDSLVDA